jgi:RNA polymerase sigma-70 factor, ECF subfamily
MPVPVSRRREDHAVVRDVDDELIERLKHGDLAALDDIYTRYARPVYSLALRILGNTADAEEVTQDVFERVWRHARSFDRGRGQFGSWLLGVTHHVAIDAVRKRQRRPQAVTVDDADRPLDSPAPDDVSETTLRNLQAEQIRRALRSLPASQQQAIELAYFNGMSHLEIAAALGDPLGTIKARIRRGMQRLRLALEGVGVEDETV